MTHHGESSEAPGPPPGARGDPTEAGALAHSSPSQGSWTPSPLSCGARPNPRAGLSGAARAGSTLLLFTVLLATLLLPTFAPPGGEGPARLGAQEALAGERIARIELQGLTRIAEAQVLARMSVRVGDRYDPVALSQEYERLSDSGDFLYIDDAVVERRADGVHIRIRFEEKPSIVEVRLSGMRSLSRKSTKLTLALREGTLFDRQSLLQDLAELERLYHEAGFAFVAIEPEIRPVDEGVQVVFRISEGNRVIIEKISFQGVNSFSRGEILEGIRLRARTPLLGIPFSGRLRRAELLESVEQLRAFYRSQGFFDAQVGLAPLRFSEGRTQVEVTYDVIEGPRYTIRAIEFQTEETGGTRALTDADLRALVESEVGAPWGAEVIQRDIAAIEDAYSDLSHVDARVSVEPVYELTGSAVTLRFRIAEGLKTFIEEIKIRGNKETRDKVIRRQLTLYPGEEFRRSEIEDSRSNLFRLGYFANVDAAMEAGSQPGYKNLIFDVEEASTGRLLFGLGLTTGRGFSGQFSLTKSNFDITDVPESFRDIPDAFSGGGQRLALSASPGTQYSRYQIRFTEPFLLDTLNSLDLDLSRSAFLRPDYTEQRSESGLAIGRRFLEDRNLVADIGYSYQTVNARDIDDDAIPSVQELAGRTHISALTAGVSYDAATYRRILGPVSGYKIRFGAEYAGEPLGGEVDMTKLDLSLEFYGTLLSDGDTRRHLLVFRNDFAWAEPRGDTESIPLFERFYLGGTGSLRGFRFREVGPKELDEPVGGTARHFGSLEYTFPLYDAIVRGVLFTDYGNLATDASAYEMDEYRLTVGGGFYLSVPFFGQFLPISLTWGDALRKEDSDRTKTLLFDIGFGF